MRLDLKSTKQGAGKQEGTDKGHKESRDRVEIK